MTIGNTYIWTDKDRQSISVTASNHKTGRRSEFYINKRFRFLPDFNFYESSEEGGRELRFSARWLWFSLNIFVLALKARKDGQRFDDRDRKWGWYFLDNSVQFGFGKTRFWGLPFVTRLCLTTQILSQTRNRVVYEERRGHWLEDRPKQEAAIKENSVAFDYCYELHNGKKQHIKATVHVTRHIRRRKWLPFRSNDDGIWVEFSEEVGPETGSWKGGVTACGWNLRPRETALACLRRMEAVRRFER